MHEKATGELAVPLVLSDWCAKDRVPKVAKVTVPEIHEALCQQAAQQRRGGELEDDDDEVGEEARKEAEAKKSCVASPALFGRIIMLLPRCRRSSSGLRVCACSSNQAF